MVINIWTGPEPTIMIVVVDLLLMLIDLTRSILNAVVQTFVRPRLKCIDGELCLITGAGGALGRLFALEFAKEGAYLVLWDCNAAANEHTAELARELGVQVHTYTVDLSKRQSIYETADRVRAEVGEVSILVNNAGVVAGRRLLDCPDELLERTLLVNCHALFWVRFQCTCVLCTIVVTLHHRPRDKMNYVTHSLPPARVCIFTHRCVKGSELPVQDGLGLTQCGAMCSTLKVPPSRSQQTIKSHGTGFRSHHIVDSKSLKPTSGHV